MTSIINWLNQEDIARPTIWTIADSKISNIESTPISAYTLGGAKVLELPVRCKNISSVHQRLYYESKLTFAYAGSTLTGLQVYSTLYSILTNLGGINNNCFPDFGSIMLKAKVVFDLYYETIRSTTEILISGFCPKTQEPFQGKIFISNARGEYKSEISIKQFELDNIVFEILGDKKDEISETISSRLGCRNKDISYWRLPKTILKELIDTNRYDTIGGNIQLAINDGMSFQLLAIVQPIKIGEPEAVMKFRNFDISEDIGINLGDCFVSINGMT